MARRTFFESILTGTTNKRLFICSEVPPLDALPRERDLLKKKNGGQYDDENAFQRSLDIRGRRSRSGPSDLPGLAKRILEDADPTSNYRVEAGSSPLIIPLFRSKAISSYDRCTEAGR
jgi:hypothetical protein